MLMVKIGKYRLIPLLVAALILPVMIKNFDLDVLVDSFKRVSIGWLGPALPLILGGLWLKGWRWRLILKTSIKTGYLTKVLMVGYLLNNILPARLGEAARVYLVTKQAQIKVKKVVASLVIEKLLDVLVLAGGLVGLVASVPGFEKNLEVPILGSLNLKARFKTYKNYVLTRYSKTEALKLGIVSVMIWLVELAWIYCLTKSFNLNLSGVVILAMVVLVNFSFVLPAPPGNLLVYEFVTVLVLTSGGINKSEALAYAIFQHMLEYVVLCLMGVWASVKLAYNPLKHLGATE